MIKNKDAYKTIGEVAKILDLVDKNRGSLSTHTIRFWEKEFNQIKPKIFSVKRRYYDNEDIKLIKLIKYLLKEKGMTIKGVKNFLKNDKTKTVDYTKDNSVSSNFHEKEKFKIKLKNLSKKISELKKLKDG